MTDTRVIETVVTINGTVVDLNQVRIGHIQLHCVAGRFLFSAGKVSLVDNLGYFENTIKLGDGLKFVISIKQIETNVTDVYNMRIFRYTVQNFGKSAKQYTFILTYDAPRWINENVSGSLTGSSAAAIKKLCESSGLTFVGDSTNDSQVWLPTGQKRANFAKFIASHGYINDKSCMFLGFDLNGSLYYRDFAQAYKKPTKLNLIADAAFSADASGTTYTVPVEGYKEILKSGLNNALVGYGYETVEQGGDNTKVHSDVKLSAESSLVNKPINDGIEGSRVKFTPISAGNTHDNYEKALHQNERLCKMFCNLVVQTLVKRRTGLNLFDPIELTVKEIVNNETVPSKRLNKKYVVMGKTIFIPGTMQYYEKHELASPGYTPQETNAKQAG